MKKARYIGGARPGVDVTFHDEGGTPHTLLVEYNHELPTETGDGVPIPASVRNGLLETDDWSEVQRSTDKGKGD